MKVRHIAALAIALTAASALAQAPGQTMCRQFLVHKTNDASIGGDGFEYENLSALAEGYVAGAVHDGRALAPSGTTVRERLEAFCKGKPAQTVTAGAEEFLRSPNAASRVKSSEFGMTCKLFLDKDIDPVEATYIYWMYGFYTGLVRTKQRPAMELRPFFAEMEKRCKGRTGTLAYGLVNALADGK